MKVLIDGAEYTPTEEALKLYSSGINDACAMLSQFMKRENLDIQFVNKDDLVELVKKEMKRNVNLDIPVSALAIPLTEYLKEGETFEEWFDGLIFEGSEPTFIAFKSAMYLAWNTAEKRTRERIANWIQNQRNYCPATGEEFANAIRYK